MSNSKQKHIPIDDDFTKNNENTSKFNDDFAIKSENTITNDDSDFNTFPDTFTESKVVTESIEEVVEPTPVVVKPVVKAVEPAPKVEKSTVKTTFTTPKFKLGAPAPPVVPITLTSNSFGVWADVGYYPPITPTNATVAAQLAALTAKSILFEGV
jgi:hypothetical protein